MASSEENKQQEEQTADTIENVQNAETEQENVQKDGECENEASVKIAELEKQLEAEKDKLLRTAAEYANFRSRTEREKAAIYANAVSDTVSELLPIADSVDRAVKASENAPEDFKKGLEMISNQLAKSFEKLNITSFGEVGEEFDPSLHNAISSIDSNELESDTIALVYQKGYKVGDKIIRHCMVQTVN